MLIYKEPKPKYFKSPNGSLYAALVMDDSRHYLEIISGDDDPFPHRHASNNFLFGEQYLKSLIEIGVEEFETLKGLRLA